MQHRSAGRACLLSCGIRQDVVTLWGHDEKQGRERRGAIANRGPGLSARLPDTQIRPPIADCPQPLPTISQQFCGPSTAQILARIGQGIADRKTVLTAVITVAQHRLSVMPSALLIQSHA
jgi:hypothetical protein